MRRFFVPTPESSWFSESDYDRELHNMELTVKEGAWREISEQELALLVDV